MPRGEKANPLMFSCINFDHFNQKVLQSILELIRQFENTHKSLITWIFSLPYKRLTTIKWLVNSRFFDKRNWTEKNGQGLLNSGSCTEST